MRSEASGQRVRVEDDRQRAGSDGRERQLEVAVGEGVDAETRPIAGAAREVVHARPQVIRKREAVDLREAALEPGQVRVDPLGDAAQDKQALEDAEAGIGPAPAGREGRRHRRECSYLTTGSGSARPWSRAVPSGTAYGLGVLLAGRLSLVVRLVGRVLRAASVLRSWRPPWLRATPVLPRRRDPHPRYVALPTLDDG